MPKEEGKFTLVDIGGDQLECDVLFTFEREETHKSYIVYTDNTKDEKGNTNVYASIFDPKKPEVSLTPIETEEEWQVIEGILEIIKKNFSEDGVVDKVESENKTGEKATDDELSEIQKRIDELSSIESEKTMNDSTFVKYIAEKKRVIDDKRRNSDQLEELLNEILRSLVYERKLSRIDSLFELISMIRGVSSSYYSKIAMSAYDKHNFLVSETALRKAIEICNDDKLSLGYKNNLAYLIRRGEIRKPEERSVKEVVILLREGTEKKDTFSLINMALLWATEFGSDNDWKMADNLASLVNRNNLADALQWWSNIANEGEGEGYLVHLFMVRNGKIRNSPLGSLEMLFDRVKKDYPNIPDEMMNIVTPFDVEWNDFPTFPSAD